MSAHDAVSPPPQYSAQFWIDHLQLEAHPEGGYFREIARSIHHVDNEVNSRRLAYTTIYFLLTPQSPSHLHRLVSDEIWLYYAGDPLQVHVILRDAKDEDRIAVPPRAAPLTPEELRSQDPATQYAVYRCVPVGGRVDRGELLQYTVPGGAIFGSSVKEGGVDGQAGYSLVSCIACPGFDYRDFELFTQADLMKLCPQHEEVIKQMAYEVIPK